MKRSVPTAYELKQNVGLRVAELRDGRGIGQDAFAEMLEVGRRYVQRLEAGQENLTIETIAKLCWALDVMPTDLMVPPTKRERAPGRPAGRTERVPRRRVAKKAPR